MGMAFEVDELYDYRYELWGSLYPLFTKRWMRPLVGHGEPLKREKTTVRQQATYSFIHAAK